MNKNTNNNGSRSSRGPNRRSGPNSRKSTDDNRSRSRSGKNPRSTPQDNTTKRRGGKLPQNGWQSRRAAADILMRIVHEGMDMDEALSASKFFDDLEGSDRGFARAIASAALRAFGRIDDALETFIDRPLEKIDPPVLSLLRVGCAQLWVLKAPSYAAVDATVEAARQWRPAARGGGMVNAILRRAVREPTAYDNLPKSHIWPDWLATRFIDTLGEETAQNIASIQLQEPRIDVTVKSDPEKWATKFEGQALPSGSVRLPTGASIVELEGYADGDWWIQDVAATLPAKLFGDVKDLSIGDLCAAPGGKTMQLSSMGANVTAVDLSEQRIEKVRENLERTGLKAKSLVADAREWRPDELFDGILLDAPCSALGTLRRHPEGAWRRNDTGLDRYSKLQLKLVDAAYDMLKSGGTMLYCVCTPMPAEGIEVVKSAIESQNWSIEPIKPEEVPGYEHAIDDIGGLLSLPQFAVENAEDIITSDIFYMARLKKV